MGVLAMMPVSTQAKAVTRQVAVNTAPDPYLHHVKLLGLTKAI